MPYHPNIPLSTDNPTQSQADLLDNFGSIASQFGTNHVPLTNGTQQGFHSQVWFAQPLASDPGLSSPQSSVYTKTVAGLTQLFFQNGGLSSNVFQLTNLVITTTATNYGFVSPWGLTFNFGYSTVSTVVFAVPFTGTVYGGFLTNAAASTGANSSPYFVPPITGTGFTCVKVVPIYYLVIAGTIP